jgi:type IV secretion system protein VirB8
MSIEADLAPYFEESRSWDADRAAQSRRSARVAWIVAGAGWLCAISATLAILGLTPLKRVEPFVIRVDNSTGIVDVVPVFAGKANFDESIADFFLRRYVLTCERYIFAIAELDYRECGAFQAPKLREAWAAAWDRNNPKSPLNVNRDGSTVRAQIISVSFFKRSDGTSDLAQVRYVRARRAGGTGAEQVSHWIATVQYTFVGPSDNPEIRSWNPFGFKVLEFKPEPEVVPDSSATSSDGSAQAGGRP